MTNFEIGSGGGGHGTRIVRLIRCLLSTTREDLAMGDKVCVQCRAQSVVSEWRPFCSEQCKLLDLWNWVDGRYRVASEETTALKDDTNEHH